MLPLCLIALHSLAALATEIRVGVVLGLNNNTLSSSSSSSLRPLTSDQEQWCADRAEDDITTLLSAAGSLHTFRLDRVYAGEDADSPESTAAVLGFIRDESAAGVGAVVGGYLSDATLLQVKATAAAAGVVLLASASGLPGLPAPRGDVVRFWPNDEWQARVMVSRFRSKGINSVVVLSRDDVTGKGLTNSFVERWTAGAVETAGHAGRLLAPVQWYNGSDTQQKPWLARLPAILAAIKEGPRRQRTSSPAASDNDDNNSTSTKSTTSPSPASAASPPTKVGFVCNCGNEEVAAILDGMEALGWPVEATAFTLTDRSTPTRAVVAVPARKAFAASVGTSGTLSALPTAGNAAYASLAARWRGDGFETSLFASACSLYDAVQIAALASLAMGGGATGGDARAVAELRATINTTAMFYNGASGAMALDGSGDLERAFYDVYGVNGETGWSVMEAAVNARALP
jgi:hypothetical protein